MLRFAYSLSALQKLILQLKNVEYEQKHFQGVVLPQAQRAEKERNDSRDVPHHGVIIGRPGLYAKEETRSKGLKI